MKTRILSAFLALVLAAGLCTSALAAAPAQAEAALVLSALDIMTGDENGDLHLERTITRAEFTRMVISASPYRDSAGASASVAPYPDVPRTHWAASYVQAAVAAGYVSGYLDGTFRPGNPITLAEGVTMVLPLLGYANTDFPGAWPAGQMAAYHTLGLDDGVSAGQDDAITRRDALYLFYNLLTARTKTGTFYLNSLEPTLNLVDTGGQLDLVALVNASMDGPVVASSGWESRLPFDPETAVVYRDGRLSAFSAIQSLDVVYWSEHVGALWVYSGRATGTLESVSPTVSAPTSITVAGKTYALETQDAVFACSDLGSCRTGDLVTVLLGRSGGAAAVLDAGVAAVEPVYGMVMETGKRVYTDETGDSHSESTITLCTTDGSSVTYPVQNTSLREGDLVRVTVEEGSIQAKRLTTASLEGTVSSDGSRLGGYTLADDVAILDTYGDSAAVRVYPSRLAGVKLTGNIVRFYAVNQQGEIEHLILNEVTGDMHTYGVLTEVREINAGMSVTGSYTVDVAGTENTAVSANAVFGVKPGPCVVKGSLQAPDRVANLTSVRLESVNGNTALALNQKFALWERAAVYEVRDGEYYLSSLDRVSGGDYILTGYYDKAQSQGGCIRVILAQAR